MQQIKRFLMGEAGEFEFNIKLDDDGLYHVLAEQDDGSKWLLEFHPSKSDHANYVVKADTGKYGYLQAGEYGRYEFLECPLMTRYGCMSDNKVRAIEAVAKRWIGQSGLIK
jgi:hypothetical protein